MRIIKYTTHLYNDRKPMLTRENSSNYSDVCRIKIKKERSKNHEYFSKTGCDYYCVQNQNV